MKSVDLNNMCRTKYNSLFYLQRGVVCQTCSKIDEVIRYHSHWATGSNPSGALGPYLVSCKITQCTHSQPVTSTQITKFWKRCKQKPQSYTNRGTITRHHQNWSLWLDTNGYPWTSIYGLPIPENNVGADQYILLYLEKYFLNYFFQQMTGNLSAYGGYYIWYENMWSHPLKLSLLRDDPKIGKNWNLNNT